MDEKRTLDEVIAIYALEPHLKDIFVEGQTDKCFVEWFLRREGANNVSIYPIDLIDVPNNVLETYGLTTGSNRSRVLALSCELATRYPNGLRVLCIADRDFEDYHTTVSANTYLAFTDYNSIDLYAFTAEAFEKFTLVALGGFPLTGCDLMEYLGSILQRVYALRLTNELLAWNMEWVPFKRYVTARRSSISFDEDRFLRAYLEKNNRWKDRVSFQDKLRDVSQLLPMEMGRKIRGHDLSELLLVLLRALRKDRKFGNSETLQGCLKACLELHDLDRTPLFQRIWAVAGER